MNSSTERTENREPIPNSPRPLTHRASNSPPAPVDLLLRVAQATPEQQASIDRILGRAPGESGAPPSEPRFVLRKGRGAWKLVFDGHERLLPDEKGIAYVAALLLDPPAEPIHAAELAQRVFGGPAVECQRNLSLDDRETARAMADSRRKCLALIDDDAASELERDEARAELEEIETWARKHLRGTEGNDQRQVRAVREAIRRLLEGLKNARDPRGQPDDVLRSFGQHLDQYLWHPSGRGRRGRNSRLRAGLAGRFTYEPPQAVSWHA